jgi:hypothetical protein
LEDEKNNDLKDYALIPSGAIAILSISPLLFALFQVKISEIVSSDEVEFVSIYSSFLGWFVLFSIVNLILCFMDRESLSKHGLKNLSGVLILILVPIYLYFRGDSVNNAYKVGWFKSNIFLIIWVVSLACSIPLEEYLLSKVSFEMRGTQGNLAEGIENPREIIDLSKKFDIRNGDSIEQTIENLQKKGFMEVMNVEIYQKNHQILFFSYRQNDGALNYLKSYPKHDPVSKEIRSFQTVEGLPDFLEKDQWQRSDNLVVFEGTKPETGPGTIIVEFDKQGKISKLLEYE